MIIEGPVCQSSQVVGWHLKNINMESEELNIHISSFGFNSSILWDPARWGRLPSSEATNQVHIYLLRFYLHYDFVDLQEINNYPWKT